MSPFNKSLNVTDVHLFDLFFLQHLSDAKKAQQNLESSFKHLESVSHVLLLLEDVYKLLFKGVISLKLLKQFSLSSHGI